MTARLPFVAYFEGGPADGRQETVTPTEHDGSFDTLCVAVPPPVDLTIIDSATASLDDLVPKVAHYQRVRERWLDLDETQAAQRAMPPGRHMVAAAYRYLGQW